VHHVSHCRDSKKFDKDGFPYYHQVKLSRPTILASSKLGNEHTGICKLPQELLVHIFEDIDDVASVVCLTLVNTLFYALGYECLVDRHRQATLAATWIGDRLICLGDYSHYDDLPENVFTADELSLMKDAAENPWQGIDALSGDNKRSRDSKLFDAAFWDKMQIMGLVNCPLAEQKRLLTLVHVEEMNTFDVDIGRPDWALFNLTTYEYVRADAFSILYAEMGPEERKAMKENQGPLVGDNLGFSELIGARICWSSDDSISMAYEGELHRGVWAGHRFEITTLDRIQGPQNGKVWKDVSDEVMKELKAIWVSEYQDDWTANL